MLSIARSRYTLPSQLVFLAANAGGVFFSTIYNANTPDLYPNNAHHKVGWIATWVVSAQVVIGLLARLAGAFKRSGSNINGMSSSERRAFIPVSTAALAEHSSMQQRRIHHGHGGHYRLSNDSGQGTEPNTESLRSNSVSTLGDGESSHQKESCDESNQSNNNHYDDFDDEDLEDARLPASRLGDRGRLAALASIVANKISSRAWNVLLFAYNFVDRTILILGFIAFALGVITYGRFFVSHNLDYHPCTLVKPRKPQPEKETKKKNWRTLEADLTNMYSFFSFSFFAFQTGGSCRLQWFGALDQGRHLLLARYLYSRTLGRLLR